MRLNSLYKELRDVDKANYYLGLVSLVSSDNVRVQIENMTLYNYRILTDELLAANKTNYYVVIDSIDGVYIAIVKESGVKNNDNVHKSLDAGSLESVLPFKNIDILAYSPNEFNHFMSVGFNNVGVGDKVYIANNTVIEKYLRSVELTVESNNLEENLLILGHHTKLQNTPFKISSNNLFNRHLMIVGATGTGKSTSSLNILESLIKNNKKLIILDPTGEYKDTFTDKEVTKYKLGQDIFLNPKEVSMEQWALLFKANENTQPNVISRAITALRYQRKNGKVEIYKMHRKNISDVETELSSLNVEDKEFQLELLADQIRENSVKETGQLYTFDSFTLGTNSFLINKINYALSETKIANFFKQSENDMFELLESFLESKENSIYINISNISSDEEIGAVIIDLITIYLLKKGIKFDEKNPFVVFIDEVHRYSNKTIMGENVLTGLEMVAREGRKLGQYLFLTTQSPLDVPENLISQVGTLLIHRLTHQSQLQAVKNYLDPSSFFRINKLGIGEAILTSSNLLENISLKLEKSERVHYNISPYY